MAEKKAASRTSNVVEDLGIPVQAVVAIGPVVGKDEKGRPSLYTTMGEGAAPLFVLQVDPETGKFEQYPAPQGINGGRPMFWSSRWNRLFVAAGGGKGECGFLLVFDPKRKKFENAGEIVRGEKSFPVSIAEAPDGSIYVGDFPKCHLVRYDVDKGSFTNCGRMDETDQYLYVLCGSDGTVACLVKMSRPHVVVYDPATGEHRSVGPVADTNTQTGHVSLSKRADGLLYVDSHEGKFRVEGMRLVPVAELPPPPPPETLPDGSRFRFLDDFASYKMVHRELEIVAPSGTRRQFHLDWTYAGTEVYIVRPGPDGRVYGSSVLPLHFFEHDPKTAKSRDFGACCTASGEIYSMDCLNGKVYFCAYTHAILGAYDPSRPWRFGNGKYEDGLRLRFGSPDDNPRQLGRIDTVAYRPRDMLCGPAGKVWVASVPDYGMWGGTLSWYDPRTDRFGGQHRGIYQDCSAYTLTYIPESNRLVVGFSIDGGSGTTPKAKRTGFVLWDPDGDREVWRGDCGLDIIGVMDLEYAGDGLVYAIVHTAPAHVLIAHLLLLDLPGNRVVKHARLDTAAGWPHEVTFQRDDRYVYGATRKSIYRVKLGTTDIEVLWTGKKEMPTCGGALVKGWYYFGAGHKLKRIRV